MVPSLFVCHGSPTLAIEENEYTRFLQGLGQQIKPEAVVIFTAHWESPTLTISSTDQAYETIYDFGGFSEELFKLTYPAKGSTTIAALLEQQFSNYGIKTKRDERRGLDHGSWVVLRRLYPQADVPVVQLSVNPYLPPQEQYKIGQAIKRLGKEDILVIGSGGTVHNLGMIRWGETTPEKWAVEFDDWLIEKVQQKNLDSLFKYEELAPHARLAVPSAEHLVPLFIALGSGSDHEVPTLLYRSYDHGTLSHICFRF
ncbi:4,5-DOPA dioxygenase extradiol [Caldalkalibacillus uzonensis]|uniref:4,5-DOPA dioxygenase extradiol n=1 Tax=Caldalkalibacillus uzonensis TaxID=353224 RepID=A0ABU0CQX7_9BACI|nr:class III extradiol ring-cleavage dioxygenase [Caldalkalibacillus uzonensis]MDQ0338810.1 4,5-DOPA dioxygenase extradiol [Caldalkalibacillus uzonensis]